MKEIVGIDPTAERIAAERAAADNMAEATWHEYQEALDREAGLVPVPADVIEACAGAAWIKADERAEAAWNAYRAAPSVDTARAYLAAEAALSATNNETVDITVIDPMLEREAIAMAKGYAIGDYQLIVFGEIEGRAWQLRLSR